MMEVFLQTWESKKASLMRSHLSKSLVQWRRELVSIYRNCFLGRRNRCTENL
jgi:hypothetical protein